MKAITTFIILTIFTFATYAQQNPTAYSLIISNPGSTVLGEAEMNMAEALAESILHGEATAFADVDMHKPLSGQAVAELIAQATAHATDWTVEQASAWGSAHPDYTDIVKAGQSISEDQLYQVKIYQEVAYDALHTPVGVKNIAVQLYIPAYASASGQDEAIAVVPFTSLQGEWAAYFALNESSTPTLIGAADIAELVAVKQTTYQQAAANSSFTARQ